MSGALIGFDSCSWMAFSSSFAVFCRPALEIEAKTRQFSMKIATKTMVVLLKKLAEALLEIAAPMPPEPPPMPLSESPSDFCSKTKITIDTATIIWTINNVNCNFSIVIY